jgi:hypothetical protein
MSAGERPAGQKEQAKSALNAALKLDAGLRKREDFQRGFGKL